VIKWENTYQLFITATGTLYCGNKAAVLQSFSGKFMHCEFKKCYMADTMTDVTSLSVLFCLMF
jgi:hypothetical protein